MAVTTQQVAEIYVATFNRAPDAAGLAYWVNDSFGGNASIEQIASSFFDSAEAQAIYTSTMTTTEKVTEAYANLFNRAPDADGLAYWVGQLDAGAVSQSNMLIALVNGALNDDATIMNNKTTVGLAFADAGLDDVTQATSVMSGVTADTATVTAAQASIDAIVNTGSSFALTNSATADTIVGTALNDTITGASGTVADADVIIDSSTTDNDTANLVVTAAYAPTTLINIENVNVDWNAYGTATIDGTGIQNATITGTSSKLGFLGALTVNDAGANDVVAGSGMVGALTVTNITNSNVAATNSSTVTVNGATAWTDTVAVTTGASTTTATVGTTTQFATASLTAGAAVTTATVHADNATVTGGAATTTVTVAAQAAGTTASTATITAAAATTVTVDGTAATTDTATITLGVNATVDVGDTTEIETVTINSGAGKTITLDGGSEFNTLNVASAGAVTLVANSAELTAETVTNSTTGLNIVLTHSAVANLANVAATQFTLDASHASAITLASGATVVVDSDVTLDAGASFAATAATATVDTLNMTIQNDQTNDIDVTAGNDFETLNLTVTLADADADDIATIGGITAKNVVVTSNSKVTLSDLDLIANGSLDMSSVAYNVVLTSADIAAAQTITGGSATNTVELDNIAADVTYIGGAGVDTVDLDDTAGAAGIAGNVTLVLGNGNNTVTNNTANGLIDKSLVVTAGTGNDSVTIVMASSNDGDSATLSNLTAELGDGNNTVTVNTNANNGAGDGETVTVTTGSGTDTLVIAASATADDIITWSAGTGTDTLDLSADVTVALSSVTLSGVEIIKVDGAAQSTVDGSDLTGTTIAIHGTGAVTSGAFTDTLKVTSATAGSYDFSGLTFGTTLTNGALGLNITLAASQSIIATNNVDTILANANNGTNTIRGGQGADLITTGSGADKIVFEATGALNGADVFTSLTAASGDVLDFSAFLNGGALLSATATEYNGTADTAIANKVVLLAAADGGVAEVDTAAEVAALIEGTGDAMSLVSGGKAVIIAGDDSAATAGATIYFVDDSLDGTLGTVGTADVVIVGTLTIDIDTILAANLDLVA